MNAELSTLYNAILEGDMAGAQNAVQASLDAGLEPGLILSDGMIAAMKAVGKLFEDGEYYVPEMLISARAMQTGLTALKPHLQSGDVKSAGKVAIGTVKGDLHDIGKNLVALMLEGAGFEVVDLGTDATPDVFVKAAQEGAQLIGMSALLTTTMNSMDVTIQAIKNAGLRNNVKIIVGGAPVTQEFAAKIGADGFAPDASRAVTLAQSLLEK
jgi:5-methyltetrahydrofolate--homocysteine methyltransferase